MTDINTTVKLNNGVDMPIFGLGLYQSQPGDEVYKAVRWAIDAGYNLADTATLYKNEESIGKAWKESGIRREDFFITTKLWPTDFSRAQELLETSLRLLQSDYVDLYLLHWPGTDADLRNKAWDVMLEQMGKGRIRACGVSNFYVHHMEEIIAHAGVEPANNQIELHPWYQRREERAYCAERGITVTSWGPIFHGHLAEEPLMGEIGEKHGKTAAQATLRWHLQHGINIIPKSVKQERIIENADIFDFELDEEDMRRVDALDGKGHFCSDADTFNGVL